MSERTSENLPGQQALWDNESVPKKTEIEPLSFTYHGTAVDDGTIDAYAYAEALLGYARMIRAVIAEISPNVTVPNIRFERTEHGSFITHVTTEVDQTLVECVRNWLTGDTATALTAGIGIAGGVKACTNWALRIIKKSKGLISSLPDEDELTKNSDDVTVTYDDGTSEIVPRNVFNITINNNFREGAQQVIKPTVLPGIDSVSFEDEPGLDPVYLEQYDRSFFSSIDPETENKNITHEVISVVRLSFDDAPWRFTRVIEGCPEQAFNAQIDDLEFYDDVTAGRITFLSGDKLEVDLEETIIKPRGGRARRTYKVLRVYNIIHADRDEPIPGLDM